MEELKEIVEVLNGIMEKLAEIKEELNDIKGSGSCTIDDIGEKLDSINELMCNM